MRHQIAAHAGLLFAGVATFILMGAGQALYGPALPAFSRLFAVGLGEAALVVSAHWVGCMFGVGFMYFKGRHVTQRRLLVLMAAGAALVAAGPQMGAGSGPGWAMTLLGAMLFGAGYGLATVVFNLRFLRAFGVRGPGMMSLLNATFGVGAIAAPLAFVALGSSPAASFGLLALGCGMVWLGAGAAGREAAATPAKVAARGFRPHWPLLGFGMVAIGIEASLIGLGPAALIASGQAEAAAARLLSGFFVTYLAVRVVLGFTAHLVAPFTLFTAAMALAALFAIGGALISPAWFFVALGGCTGLFFPGFFVSAAARMGDDARVAPTIIAAGLVGGIFAPLILMRYLEAMGERGFFWVLAGVAGAVTLAAFGLRRSMKG